MVALTALLLTGTPAVVPQPAAAATARLTPNQDVANAWQVKPNGGQAWQAVDDALQPPTSVPATDWIWAGAAGRGVELALTSTAVGTAAVTGGGLDYFANTGVGTQLRVDVLWRGAVRHTATLPAAQGFAWRRLPISPRSQADVDTLQVRFTTIGGGDANVRAVSAEVRTTPLLSVLDWEAPGDRVVPERAPAGWSRQYADNAWALREAQASEPVRAGSWAGRFELREKDRAPNGWGSRAELVKVPIEPDGAERWYGFSLFLPADSWQRDRSAEILTQWHQAGNTGSPPLGIGTRDLKWEVFVNGVAVTQQAGDPAYRTGAWTDWVVHARWSATSTGLIEVWRNGTKVFTKSGANKPNDGQGVYPKIGIYKWDWADEPAGDYDTVRRVVYQDEFRIGDRDAGYDAVVPR